MTLSESVLLYGLDAPLPQTLTVRAGPLTATIEEGTLRFVRVGSHEVLHQVYSAVRDHNWSTIPGQLEVQEASIGADAFTIRFRSEHRQDPVHFVWWGHIRGEADGRITFSMEGEVLSAFRRNRIGFCILHPMNCAGKPCSIETSDGGRYESTFPDLIAPLQPFHNIRAITHEVQPGLRLEVRMEGDIFETEDQRNWSDASYKTYCTPLERPFPVTVTAGTKISQRITLALSGAISEPPPPPTDLTLTLTDQSAPIPPIGLGVAHHPLSAGEIGRLRALNLSHLRAEVHLEYPDHLTRFRQAAHEANALGVALEIALFLSDGADLRAFTAALDETQPKVCRWIVFDGQGQVATPESVALVRQSLGSWAVLAPVGVGTVANFTELNRIRPPKDAADVLAYAINPQVHATDLSTLTETLPVHGLTVQTARIFAEGRPICVGPITLKMQRNPAATGPDAPTPPGQLPPQVDVRQMSLYGAGWALGSIKHLAQAGAGATTYFETVGWLGVMETAAGSPVPGLFQSVPGGVYPMYHVFADVGDFRGGEVLISHSSDPMQAEGLVLRRDGHTRILLANYTPVPQTIWLPGVGGQWALTALDSANAEAAMSAPEAFRAMVGSGVAAADGLRVTLAPFGLARLDQG